LCAIGGALKGHADNRTKGKDLRKDILSDFLGNYSGVSWSIWKIFEKVSRTLAKFLIIVV